MSDMKDIVSVANSTFGKPVVRPTENWLGILQQGYDDYIKYDEQRKNRAYTQKLREALEGGDQEEIFKAFGQANPTAYMDYLTKVKANRELAEQEFGQKKDLLGLQNQYDIALQNIKNQALSSNGFGNTQAGLALRIASNPSEYDQSAQEWANNYLASNSSSAMYDKAYQGARGRKEAEKEISNLSTAQSSASENETIDNIIASINENPDLVGVYSPIKTNLSRFTGGMLGYNSDELTKRGSIIRQLGNVQNSLIAKAKAAGQSGINTLSEIQQTTKGLDENSSPEEITGALNVLKRINNDIISGKAFGKENVNKTTNSTKTEKPNVLTNIAKGALSALSDEELLGGL